MTVFKMSLLTNAWDKGQYNPIEGYEETLLKQVEQAQVYGSCST
jgi:hypothetical protein